MSIRFGLTIALVAAGVGAPTGASDSPIRARSQPIVIRVEGGFHWIDAGLGAAAALAAALAVLGLVLIVRQSRSLDEERGRR
jgi:hypothetical protein